MKRHASMNRVYRLIWNQAMNTWIAVAENAKGRSKGSSRKLIAAALAVSASMAHAAPTGGQLVSGSGSIVQNGAVTTITQSSQNLSVNWQGFNIAPTETVNFVQPSATALAVNRIFDTNGTQILGHLNANGQIYLINPNGILFGKSAQVNVGGLVSSTLDNVSSGNGMVSFSGNGTGSVVNLGTIHATGYVAFIGNKVSNQGTITAPMGSVGLGAGSAVTLTFEGSLMHIRVDQSTLDNLAENGGLIKADGGMVILTAGAKDALLASAVNNTGVIEAQTVENHAGTITLLGGMTAGTTNVGGTLDASAPNGGNGGFIETSAHDVQIASNARVTTASASGLSGNWLIDPVDFTIAASGGDMTGATLSSSLNLGSVTIQSSSGASGTAGNINVNDTVSWSAHTLTLNAQNNININNVMNASGTAGLALEYGQASPSGGTSTYNINAPVNLLSGASFSTKLGTGGTLLPYTVINDVNALQSINTNTKLSGDYVLGSDISNINNSGHIIIPNFAPIGSGKGVSPFSGIFDGLGHTISKLSILQPKYTLYAAGLFGNASSSAIIRDVGLISASVTGNNNVGVLAGSNLGTITNSYTQGGSVKGNGNVGGLAGSNGGTISNSYAQGGSVTASGSNAGGLAGSNSAADLNAITHYGTINNSYADMTSVTGSSAVGALVGYNPTGTVSNHATVSNSFYNSGLSLAGIGSGTTTGATGLDATGMMTQSNFAGFDFSSTWVIYGGYTAPLLSAFMTPLTVTANDAAKTYDRVAYTNGNGVSYSLPSPLALSLSGTSTYGGTSQGAINAGTYSITTAGLYSNQQGYNISYANGTLNIAQRVLTGSIAAGSSVYGSALNPGVATLSNVVAGDQVSAGAVTVNTTGHTSTSGHLNAGSYNGIESVGSTLSGADAANYTFAGATGNYTVSPLALTGSITTGSSVYGSALNPGVATLSNVVAGDQVSAGAVTVNTTGHTSTSGHLNAGSYTGIESVSSLSGADAANYTFAGATGNYTVSQLALTGSIATGNSVYGSSLTPGAATLNNVVAGDQVSAGAVTVNTAGHTSTSGHLNAGSYNGIETVSSLSGADAANYTSANVTGNYTVSQLEVIVAATGANKVYDGNVNDAATLSSTGIISGDTVNLADTSATFANKNVGNGKTVTVSGISASGTDAANYTVNTTATTTANITPAALTLGGITASNKVYDGTTAATLNTAGITFSGLVSGDSVSLGGAGIGTFADKNVGTGKTVTVSGYTLGGADAGNYTAAQPSGLTANITPATLTYTATPAVFTVGQTPSGLSGSAMGFVSTDNLVNSTTGTLAWNTPATASSPQGHYSIDGTGLNATNYNFAQAIGNATALTLNAAPITTPPETPPTPTPTTTTNPDTLAALLNNHPAPLGLSPTITVLSSSSTGAGGEPTPVVIVKKKVTMDGVGPTLYIVDGGLRLPDAN